MPIQKLSAQNNGWPKKEVKIIPEYNRLSYTRDYSEETLWIPKYYIVGLELEIVVKRHLVAKVLLS